MKTWKFWLPLLFGTLMTLLGCQSVNQSATVTPTQTEEDSQSLILATTTSTYDSGLLDYILPDFEEKYQADVKVIAVGTGQALALGENGDADVLLVHARAREDEFVSNGDGKTRYDVMYNDFVIVGDAADPAGIQGMNSATEAFQKIADTLLKFISRGDDSGHTPKNSRSGKWQELPRKATGTFRRVRGWVQYW